MGLSAIKSLRQPPAVDGPDECGSADRAFRLIAVGVSMSMSIAVGYLVWLMAGPIPAAVAAVIVLAIVGSVFDRLF